MSIFVVIALVIVGVIIIVAISGKVYLKSGKILDKQYTPSRIQMMTIPVGKSFSIIPQVIPENHQLLLEGEYNGKIIQEWHSVSRETYGRYKVGDMIKFED